MVSHFLRTGQLLHVQQGAVFKHLVCPLLETGIESMQKLLVSTRYSVKNRHQYVRQNCSFNQPRANARHVKQVQATLWSEERFPEHCILHKEHLSGGHNHPTE